MPSRKCPVCGTSVNAENLPRHLASVHPKDATSEMVREAKQSETRTTRPARMRKRSLRTRPSWRIPVAILVIALIAGGAYVVATSNINPYSPYNANTPVTDMCVDHTAIPYHYHVTLRIVISGSQHTIPGDVGRPPTSPCMRPLHTHLTDGVIHIESPVPHEFTLRDFFTVWAQPFSSSQILGYSRSPGHPITMTVNGASSSEFENYVFPHLENATLTTIVITYQ